MKHLIRYLGIAILGMALAISAVAQTVTSTIVGRITDTNGAIVAGAEVAVTHIGTNQTRTVLTNESGEFRIPQLSPGTYTIRVSMANFKVTNSEEIDLLTDSTQRVNLTLEPGDINENVTVTAEAPVLNTETSEKAEVITQRQVEELPMNVRDFTELAKLVPGIYQRPTEDDQGQGVGSSGTRTDSTGFLLDGTSNRDDRNGSVGVNTSVDSIQEFKVSTSTYSGVWPPCWSTDKCYLKIGNQSLFRIDLRICSK